VKSPKRLATAAEIPTVAEAGFPGLTCSIGWTARAVRYTDPDHRADRAGHAHGARRAHLPAVVD
jgi:hypothetical protein